jgi:uncharacterized protein (TIGR04222 family)
MTPATWGIPGPTFLIAYLGAIIVVAILAAVHRRIISAGRADDVNRLGAQEIAYLTGRDRLAVYTAIGGLRASGAIGSGPDKTLLQTGPMPTGVTPLDTAVYNAAGRRIPAREVVTDTWVQSAVDELRQRLEEKGLATTAAQRRIARLWLLPAVALILLGIARLVAGIRNDHPVGFLVPSIFFAVIMAVTVLVRASRVTTAAATKGVAAIRRQSMYLSPRQSPSYATYGATGAAMGVALFGASSLYAMDPAFAADAEIQRVNAAGWSAGTSGGGGSCGSSSSCGGSSGGGGGGCGGGGCGG